MTQRMTAVHLRQRRMVHTALLAIIIATLPCYCLGAIMLGLSRNEPRDQRATLTAQANPSRVTLTALSPGITTTPRPSITPLPTSAAAATATALQFGTPISTPGQYVPPPPTRFLTATFTPPPTFTATIFIITMTFTPIPTSTTAPTVTLTFTYTPSPTFTDPAPPTFTDTPTPTATATATDLVPATDAFPTPTSETALEDAGTGEGT